MHLVFLSAQQHLKAGLTRWRHAGGELDTLREKVVGLALQPLCPALPFVAQKRDDLRLAARPLLLGHDAPHQPGKVECFKRGAPLDCVDLFRHPLPNGDVSEYVGYRSCFRRRSEAVPVLRDFLGHDQRVLSHSAKAISQVFGSVIVHG